MHEWRFWGRPNQFAPAGDWTIWLLLGGRGFGKTRSGAEWVREEVESERMGRIALVAKDAGDARDVMVEGESGLLAISPPWFRPRYEPSKRRVTWPNGAVATLYSDADPEALRGPQFDGAWADELGKWRYAEKTWDNLQFGLRLGLRPRQVVTTTPRSLPLLKQIIARSDTILTAGSTYENRANMAPAFFAQVIRRYEGSRLGRQELEGHLLEDVAGALWQRAWLDKQRVAKAPDLKRIVVAVDPPASSEEGADECGIVVAGKSADDHAYVLADRSGGGMTPSAWASRAIAAYHEFEADAIVAEANQGGEMVKAVLQQADNTVPIKLVHATRGKAVRAEPVALIYEQGRGHHVGTFAEMEDQMCVMTLDYDRSRQGSPDRLDALVWAITELLPGHRSREPKVRTL